MGELECLQPGYVCTGPSSGTKQAALLVRMPIFPASASARELGPGRGDCECGVPQERREEREMLVRARVCPQGRRWAGWPLSPSLGVRRLFGRNSLRAEGLAHCEPFSSPAACWPGLTSDSHFTSKRNHSNFSPNEF